MKKGLLLLLSLFSWAVLAQSTYPSDEFSTQNEKKIKITFIKHSSLAIEYDGIHIQIDPVTDYKGNITDYSMFPKADYILLTHEHQDHFDESAIALLEKTSTQIVLNEATQSKLGRGIAMKNGDKRNWQGEIRIEAVPAYNTTAGREKYHPKGRDNGYILSLDGFRIYISGDTEDIPELHEISAIDVAFLPVNQPYTMTLEQAEKAVGIIKPTIFYPYHFDDTPVENLIQKLEDTAVEVRIRPMN